MNGISQDDVAIQKPLNKGFSVCIQFNRLTLCKYPDFISVCNLGR